MLRTQEETTRIGEMGTKLYHERIKHQLTDAQLGMMLAVDVNSGEYEVGGDYNDLFERLTERVPDSQIVYLRHGPVSVGYWGGQPEEDDSWIRV